MPLHQPVKGLLSITGFLTWSRDQQTTKLKCRSIRFKQFTIWITFPSSLDLKSIFSHRWYITTRRLKSAPISSIVFKTSNSSNKLQPLLNKPSVSNAKRAQLLCHIQAEWALHIPKPAQSLHRHLQIFNKSAKTCMSRKGLPFFNPVSL